MGEVRKVPETDLISLQTGLLHQPVLRAGRARGWDVLCGPVLRVWAGGDPHVALSIGVSRSPVGSETPCATRK